MMRGLLNMYVLLCIDLPQRKGFIVSFRKCSGKKNTRKKTPTTTKEDRWGKEIEVFNSCVEVPPISVYECVCV